MCFLKECLCPVGVYRKRSDTVVRTNQSICFPPGMLRIVYSATFISQLLFIHQTCTFFSSPVQRYASEQKAISKSVVFFQNHLWALTIFACVPPLDIYFPFISSIHLPLCYPMSPSSFSPLVLVCLSFQLVPSPPAAPWSPRKRFRPVRFCCHGSQEATACHLCATTQCSSENFQRATGQSIQPLSTMRSPPT